MTNSLFETNGLNHGDDFLHNPHAGTGRTSHTSLNQTSHSHRDNASEGGRCWFEQNSSDIDQDVIIPDWHPSAHRETTTATSAEPNTSIPWSQKCGGSLENLPLVQGEWGLQVESPSKQGKPSKNPRYETVSDPPLLVNEDDGGWIHPISLSPSQMSGGTPIKGKLTETSSVHSPTMGIPELIRSGKLSTLQESSSTELLEMVRLICHLCKTTNVPDWWRQQAGITIRICYRLHGSIFHGQAVQTIELLRRCFYPRRDVIKW